MKETLYERISRVAKERGTNISTVCKEVTGNTGNLATWKNSRIRSDYLAGIAQYLNCSTDYLLDIEIADAEQRREQLQKIQELSDADFQKLYDIAAAAGIINNGDA